MGVKITQEMIAGAQATERKYGVPASVTLGQIMLESGGSYDGGLSGLAYYYNNLFGIKATANDRASGNVVTMDNKAGTDRATYKVYKSIADSIEHHGQLLTNDRYTAQTKNATTVYQYAQGIANAGYATDPNYANKLINIIQSNNLEQYDVGAWGRQNWKDAVSGDSSTSEWKPIYGATDKYEESLEGNLVTDAIEETELKAWGDIVVIVLVVLLIGASILFFMQAFKISLPSPMGMVSKVLSKGEKANE